MHYDRDRLHFRGRWVAAALLAVAAGLCPAAEGILIEDGGSTSFIWQAQDGAGFRWDIYHNGAVNDGTNDAYDGGMNLQVNGSTFSWGGSGVLSKDGREVQVGPWRQGQVQIWRRIYIDPKLGYARWVDIFQNTATQAQSVNLRYQTNVGSSINSIQSTSGAAAIGPKDWGFVTDSRSRPRPAIAHVFASKASKVRPSVNVRVKNNDVTYSMALQIPAGKTVALCLFEAQRNSEPEAAAFLKAFRPAQELAKLPPALRAIIVNMQGSMLSLGNIELPRSDAADMVVLRNGNELLGKLQHDAFTVNTFFGRCELPAARVLGLLVPDPSDPLVQLVLNDGQVVSGTMDSPLLRLQLSGGDVMQIPPADLQSAAYAVSTQRPEEIPLAGPVAVLRSGERLAFDGTALPGTFHCEYGELNLDLDDLGSIALDTPDNGLHRAVFRNGSVLSGLLVTEQLSLPLLLGPKLDVPRQFVSQFVLTNDDASEGPLCRCDLRNEDVLLGVPVDEALPFRTPFGTVRVRPHDLAEMQRVDESFGQYHVRLHDGTTLTGRLDTDTLHFEIRPGPVIPVHVGHIVKLTCPKGAVKPPADATPTTAPGDETDQPTTAPAPEGNPPEAGSLEAHRDDLRRQMEEIGRELDALRNTRPSDPAAAENLKMQTVALLRQMQNLRAELAKVEKQIQEQAGSSRSPHRDTTNSPAPTTRPATTSAPVERIVTEIGPERPRPATAENLDEFFR